MLNEVAREQHRQHADIRARIGAPRTIVIKPRPRAFRPSPEALRQITSRVGPQANAHVIVWRAYCRTYPTVDLIVRTVSLMTGVSAIDIRSGRRTFSIILPRHVCMYLARRYTLLGFPLIGRGIGGRDHSTVMYGSRKIERLLAANDPVVVALVKKGEERLADMFPELFE